MKTIYGFKSTQSQAFTATGVRVPTTLVKTSPHTITQIKTADRDGYWSVQLAIGQRKRTTRPLSTHTKGLTPTPLFLREVRLAGSVPDNCSVGNQITPDQILVVGDLVNVTSVSKGKGFAGVVKRHHFRGGPKTHGQSDRHRAPGSIGQTTTPGRVYKGKRMAGRMGGVTRTQRNITVLSVSPTDILLRGTIPGPVGSLTTLTKTGTAKKFAPLPQQTNTTN